jgi:predicted dehydrogenase
VTAQWGGTSYDDLDRMIEDGRPEVVYVAVPPHRAVAIGEKLVAHRIPFLTEKPLAAADADGPARLADAIEQSRVVVAVGYHLRALDIMAEVRARLAQRPAQMFVARWLDSTPGPSWWGRTDEGGGQVIEQATHLYDLARYLVGEATVVGAASTRDPLASPVTVDVADSSAAVLRFESGAVGSLANTRRLSTAVIEVEIISDGLLTRLSKHPDRGQGDWHASFDDGTVIRAVSAECDPYEKQAAAFLDAVEWADPGGVLSSYEDALKTDRLTRAVVAATGVPG